MAVERVKGRVGTRAITLALAPNTEFKDIVRVLEKTLVVPKIPGVGGCDPCLSGLDRLVVESSILTQ
ncbi:MAG TPA: hypothetical protein VF100_09580 [Thermoanaerobaculia bacterium]